MCRFLICACPFLAPFSSVFYTPELSCRPKSNSLGNGQYIYLRGSFNPYTSGIQSRRDNTTVDVGQHYTNSSSLGIICTNNGLITPKERITNRTTGNFLNSLSIISGLWNVFSTTFILVPHSIILIVNKLIAYCLFYNTIASVSLQFLCFYFQLSQAYFKMMRISDNRD